MTFSSIGKKRRLNRLFKDGKTIIVPIDDSLIFGPKQGLFDIATTIKLIIKGAPNALLGFKTDVELITNFNCQMPFIYNITASTVMSMHTKKVVIASVENALSSGADCVAAHINFSSQYESEMLQNFAMIANECDRLGVPLLAISYPRNERDGKDYNYDDIKEKDPDSFAEIVAHCARISCELGADIIKTNYTGTAKSFEKVVKAACGRPVIIAGGPKVPVEQSLEIVDSVMKAGGAGISFGRNIFNADNIASYLSAIRAIVFKSEKWQKTLEKYNQTIGG
ncbi:MAG: hypothetical protein LBU83_08610 [Bacteroidales bacterium]|jgi:DhnA family fructose-bisphosphate aldolase class Ia|nr:hypothetical protein [Bacteroidales bacterium]